MSKPRKIPCRRCDGTGEVELDAILAGELHVLRDLKCASATEMDDETPTLRIGKTAHNKRLERLREMGLVKRTRSGKQFFYEPA